MVQFKGLADVIIHANRQAGFAVRGHGVGGHRNDGQTAQAQLLANATGGFKTVHHRHLQVHQDHVVSRLHGQYRIHAQPAVVGQGHHRALLAEQALRNRLVDFVVLHHQQAHAQQPLGLDGLGSHHRFLPGARLQCACFSIHHRIEQHGRCYRLDQKAVERSLRVGIDLRQHVAPMGRHHEHQGRRTGAACSGDLANLLQGLPAVHLGHLPVHQHHLVGRARLEGSTHPLHGVCSAGCEVSLPAQRARHDA